MSAKTDESDPAGTFIGDLSNETARLAKYYIRISTINNRADLKCIVRLLPE